MTPGGFLSEKDKIGGSANPATAEHADPTTAEHADFSPVDSPETTLLTKPRNSYVWRCLCGFEVEKFGKVFTNHLHEGRKGGDGEHQFRLVDKETGEIVAESMADARKKGYKNLRQDATIPAAGFAPGAAASTDDGRREPPPDTSKDPYKPNTPVVVKFVQYTAELDGRLLLLYELTLPMYQAAGYVPTIEEWIEDSITQFYREHAEDFKFNNVVKNFVEGNENVV